MGQSFLKLSSAILYWKYTRERESEERNQKIYECYTGMGISNIILSIILFALILIIGSYFGKLATVLDTAFMVSFIFGIIHYLLQKLHALEIYVKVKNTKQ